MHVLGGDLGSQHASVQCNIAWGVAGVLQELRQELEEERKANDQLIDQTDRDRAKIDDLEGRCRHLALASIWPCNAVAFWQTV